MKSPIASKSPSSKPANASAGRVMKSSGPSIPLDRSPKPSTSPIAKR